MKGRLKEKWHYAVLSAQNPLDKSSTEARISSVFAPPLAESSEAPRSKLVSYCSYCVTAFRKNHNLPSLHLCIVKAGPEAADPPPAPTPGEELKHHEVRDRRGALLLRSRRPYKHDASGWWAPGDPWESGCMPPTALSPSSGGRIKEVSLTGLTCSHPLHQSWRGQRSDQLDPSAPQSATGA